MNSLLWMLAARLGEALGLQVGQCPATRALDLYFNNAACSGEFAVALAATYVLHENHP
ncbi:hypothetical protein D3C72_823430 [compost metagenome]